MRLPNKIISFNKSVISKFPLLLATLKHADMTVSDLYNAVHKTTEDVGDFLEILDCLYALGQIEYDAERGLLRYVGRN